MATMVGLVLLALAICVLAAATWAAVTTRSRAWTLTATLLWAGVASFTAYNVIGSTIDESGGLHEPFALVPIGWMLILAGTFAAAFTVARPSAA